MTRILWYDPNFKSELPDGFIVNFRSYPADSDDQKHASALRILNEWVQWDSVELEDAVADSYREILADGDGAAAYEAVIGHEQVELRE